MAEVQSIKGPSARVQHPKEYNTWKAMKSRCSNPNNPSWKYYGAKGITVCGEWIHSFETFLRDMGPAPSAAHQIDRGRNELGYCRDNCCWSTPAEQQGPCNGTSETKVVA